MELSNDQKAILRLLTQRGADGYEDLAALLGIDAAEVHERAKAAAAQLEADGIPAPSIPAPGASRMATAPEPTKPAPASEPAAEPTAEPMKPVPPSPPAQAEPPAAAKPPATPPSPTKVKPSRSKFSLPESGSARAALAAGVAIVIALVIVILVSGGGDSGDTTSTSSTTASESDGIAAANPKLTQAVLSPVDGGDGKGLATFGRVKNTLALQLEAEGLEPTAKGESYTVWLYDTSKKRVPLASTTVGANGKIGAQVEVPTEVLAYLANETFDQLYLSRTDDATLKAALAKATKEKKEPIYTGTDVLAGTITGPIIGAAKKK